MDIIKLLVILMKIKHSILNLCFLDFGFAQTRNVPDNSIGGSPLYMAPERLINYKK